MFLILLDRKFLKILETVGTKVITTFKTVNLWNYRVSNQKKELQENNTNYGNIFF